jgi:hypothetical protein
MSRAELVSLQGSILAQLRETIARADFRDGVIVAVRHQGRIVRVEVTTVARQDDRALRQPGRGQGLSAEQVGRRILDCLDRSLRDWVFEYGRFEFTVANRDVVETILSIRILPKEEELLVRLRNE